MELDDALREYESRGKEDADLERLSKKFQRDGCIADREDFLEIVKWKAQRSLGYARRNHVSAIREATKLAFDLAPRGQTKEALDALGRLKGVKTRMATAILTFYNHERFTVMDPNAWRSLVHLGALSPFDCWFEESVDYPAYLAACHAVAESYGHTLRDTDRALWALTDLRAKSSGSQ